MNAEVLLCCGVGGVGKTTLAAALALGHARAGRRVVVITVDPARRLADALGIRLGSTPTPVPFGEGRLDAMMLDAKVTFDRTVRELSVDPRDAEALIAHRFAAAVRDRLAGTPEYLALVELDRLVRDGRWDLVVVDTPPAEDALDLFRAPARLRRLLPSADNPAGRVGRLAAATLGRLIGATVVDDILGFFRPLAGLAGGFRGHADAIASLFASGRARTLLVVDARAPDRGGTAAFRVELARVGPAFAGFLVNRVIDDPGSVGAPGGAAPPGIDADAWAEAVAAIRAVAREQAAEAARHRQVVARLRAEGPVWTVPELEPSEDLAASLAAIAACLPPAAPPQRAGASGAATASSP